MGKKTFLLIFSLLLLGTVDSAVAQQAETEPRDRQTEERQTNLQFQVGFNALTDGNLDEAMNRLERAVASDTEVPKAYYWLGKTYFYKGYNDSAVDVLKRADTFPSVREWARRELAMHRLRYQQDTFSFHREWDYVGLIEGERYDERRNINPSALEPAPLGGWYSTSYRDGKLLKYSEEGRVLQTWSGFQSPVDVKQVEGLGVLVAELRDGRIIQLTDTGVRRPFVTEELEAPSQILSVNSSLYAVDSADQRIVQLTRDGDTAGVVWEAPANVNLKNVSVGPDNNFWVLDDQEYQLYVISPGGVTVGTHSWNRNLDLEKIWWRRGVLLAVGSPGILYLDRSDFTASPLSSQGDTLPGGDVSDIHMTGDRLVVSSFESSELLIYRPTTTPDPDMIVDQRRFDFTDFPVIRANVVLEDPLRSHRFEHLVDENLEIEVNNLDILPSVLRHTKETYGNDWIMLVDNRISKLRAWEEIRPYLERVINHAPDDTRGSVWSVAGSSVIKQGFTPYSTKLNNGLNQLNFYSGSGVTAGDTLLARRMHQAFETMFSRRSSGGMIVVSRHLNELVKTFDRVANRSLNNNIPVFMINPGAGNLGQSSRISETPSMFYQHFGNLNSRKLWGAYRSFQNHHYTLIYRSNLRYQASSLWRNLDLGFHYLDRVFRYRGGFLIP